MHGERSAKVTLLLPSVHIKLQWMQRKVLKEMQYKQRSSSKNVDRGCLIRSAIENKVRVYSNLTASKHSSFSCCLLNESNIANSPCIHMSMLWR